MLAYLASRGVAVTLAGTQHCAECIHGAQGEARLGLHLEAVEALRGIAGSEKWAEISVPDESATEPGKAGHDPSRRHLFRRFIGRGADQLMRPISATEASPVPLKAIRFAAPFSTAGRELLQILFEAKQENQPPLPAHPALYAAKVGIRTGLHRLRGVRPRLSHWRDANQGKRHGLGIGFPVFPLRRLRRVRRGLPAACAAFSGRNGKSCQGIRTGNPARPRQATLHPLRPFLYLARSGRNLPDLRRGRCGFYSHVRIGVAGRGWFDPPVTGR